MTYQVLEVEMMCIADPEGKRNSKVQVVSSGPYQGWYVRFSKAARVIGARYKGKVYGQSKWDADRQYCNLIGRDGKVDPEAFQRL